MRRERHLRHRAEIVDPVQVRVERRRVVAAEQEVDGVRLKFPYSMNLGGGETYCFTASQSLQGLSRAQLWTFPPIDVLFMLEATNIPHGNYSLKQKNKTALDYR